MRKSALAVIVGLGLGASWLYLIAVKPVAAAQTEQPSVAFNADGTVQVPTGFRKWVFVGAPLTPEGLNDGQHNCDAAGKNCTKSNFPEYHHVYIEQKNVDVYLKTGDFPEGTVIVKELTRVLNPTFPDSSRNEPSGRGYFNGAYNGIDMSIKDSKRFAKQTTGACSLLGIIRCRTTRRQLRDPRANVPAATSPTSQRPT
jgi:hypothetical protein